MHAAACIAQALGQPGLDGRVAIFEAVVQHEAAAAEIIGQYVEFARNGGGFVVADHADARQALHVGLAGLDVVQEEFPVKDDIRAGEEFHDPRVHLAIGFLPQGLCHGD